MRNEAAALEQPDELASKLSALAHAENHADL